MTRNQMREKQLQQKLARREMSASEIIHEMAMRTGHVGLHSLSIAVRYPEKEQEAERE